MQEEEEEGGSKGRGKEEEVREEKEEGGGGRRVKRRAYEVTEDLAWLCCVYLDLQNIKVIACNQTEARS